MLESNRWCRERARRQVAIAPIAHHDGGNEHGRNDATHEEIVAAPSGPFTELPLRRNSNARILASMFGPATPIFRVASRRESLDYFVNVLGFKIDWQAEGPIASVSSDRCIIFLCEGDQGNPGAWTWIGVPDAAALCEEYRGKGAKIRNPPMNYRWAYEMQIEDLDGNVLRFGSIRSRISRRMVRGGTCTEICG